MTLLAVYFSFPSHCHFFAMSSSSLPRFKSVPTVHRGLLHCCREVGYCGTLAVLLYVAYMLGNTPLSRVQDTVEDIGDVVYSKSKQKLSEDSLLKHVSCASVKCTWFDYNSTYPPPHKSFHVYEDQEFTLDPLEPELFCRPDTFGYSNEEAEEIFPFIGFPRCKEKFPGYRKAMFINGGRLTMNCSGEFRGKYVLGTRSHMDKFKLPSTYWGEVRLYEGPVQLESGEEWALGTCDPQNENLFEQVEIQLRPDAAVLNATQAKMEEMYTQYASETNTQRRKSIIFLLVVDSASRRHFYRKFPKTLKVLEGLEEGYEVTDFLIHNVIGDNSARNQIPIFTGRPRLTFRGRKGLDGTVEDVFRGDALSPNTLYHDLREFGFVSFFGFEFCHQYFAMYMGDQPEVDHLAANFWCGARQYAGFHFEKSVYGQRCIGPDMSHQHMLEYVRQFTNGYSSVNQLIYTHLTAGHEATGTHIETLDADLAEFLTAYIPLAESFGFELSVLLHGDHGMRYGEWYKNIAAFQEHRLPALFTILPRTVLGRVTSAYDILEHNRRRLTSKLDLYLTVKSLALLNYMEAMNRYTIEYRSWKGIGYLGSAMSIVLEKVPNTRGCENVFIPPFYCACMKMNLIDRSIYDQSDSEFDPLHPLTLELSPMLTFLSSLSMEIANSIAYTNSASFPNSICRQLTLSRIVTVYAQKITRGDEAFKMEFTVNEHKTARFESYTVVGNTDKYVGNKEDMEAFPAAQYFFRDRTVFARVLFIKRLDKYAGMCEDISFDKKINPQMCVCHPVDTLKWTVPREVRSLFGKFTLLQSELPGKNCSSVCESKEMKCDDFYSDLLRDEELLKEQVWTGVAQRCRRGQATGVLETETGVECVVSRGKTDGEMCDGDPPNNIRRLCPCH